MERIVDKTIIAICCLAVLLLIQPTTAFVVGMLLALAISALQETSFLPKKVLAVGLYAYLAAALIVPACGLFVPLIAYDCVQKKNWALKLCWVLPIFGTLRAYDFGVFVLVTLVAVLSCIFSLRTTLREAESLTYRALRDELRGLSLSLEQKNRDLQEKQDYEVRLATLAERGRIAREIHDNVGHLLTRSVLQIEAAQVVYADNTQVKKDLEQVGETIHEAFATVRASVHDLHDDAFDLYTQLYTIAQNSMIEVDFDYHAEDVPDAVAYGFVAITREAVANAEKHSDASRVKLSIIEYPAFCQLLIHDNGSKNPFGNNEDEPERGKEEGRDAKGGDSKGRDAKGGDAKGRDAKGRGIGLKTMEERARSLGGVFRVDYDKGFRVFVSIPKDVLKEP